MKKWVLLVVGVFTISAGSLFANELWVSPASANTSSNVGNWAVMKPGTVYFSFHVPDNLQAFTAATVVLIPRKTTGLSYDLYASGTTSANMQDDFNTQLLAQSKAVTANTLTEIDVSSIIQSVLDAKKDFVTLFFSGGNDGQVVGLRFSYVGPTGPKGDAPTHEWQGTLLRFQNPDGTWGSQVNLVGPQGPQGIQGIQGIQGPPGPPNENIITQDEDNESLANTSVGKHSLASIAGNTGLWGNAALGFASLYSLSAGNGNTALGYRALWSLNNSGYNTAVGFRAMPSLVEGRYNVAVGNSALENCQFGNRNVAIGRNALYSTNDPMNSGDWAWGNVAVGDGALIHAYGRNNIAVGVNAGYNLIAQRENNIYIGSPGFPNDDGSIQIGNHQASILYSSCWIQGIWGHEEDPDVTDYIPVIVNQQGHMGTHSSSMRFKTDINDMGDVSSRIFQLRPITFHNRSNKVIGSQPLRFGLIAEEVAKIYPELVVNDREGQPYTVLYDQLPAMLLNEIQKQQNKINELSQELQRQAELIARLEAQLAALEEHHK